jgi:amidophosphoribosyltransferase
MEEACGVFGVYAPQEDVATLSYFGLFALQHRGQESAGIATFNQGKLHVYKHMGLVSQVFDDTILKQLTGQYAVGHTRYSTTGSSRLVNAQPAIAPTHLGQIALAHNGNLVNADDLKAELNASGYDFISTADTELLAYAVTAGSMVPSKPLSGVMGPLAWLLVPLLDLLEHGIPMAFVP